MGVVDNESEAMKMRRRAEVLIRGHAWIIRRLQTVLPIQMRKGERMPLALAIPGRPGSGPSLKLRPLCQYLSALKKSDEQQLLPAYRDKTSSPAAKIVIE